MQSMERYFTSQKLELLAHMASVRPSSSTTALLNECMKGSQNFNLAPLRITLKDKQEIRTKRYVTVTLEGLDLSKKCFISWYDTGNGLPELCYTISPGKRTNFL